RRSRTASARETLGYSNAEVGTVWPEGSPSLPAGSGSGTPEVYPAAWFLNVSGGRLPAGPAPESKLSLTYKVAFLWVCRQPAAGSTGMFALSPGGYTPHEPTVASHHSGWRLL